MFRIHQSAGLLLCLALAPAGFAAAPPARVLESKEIQALIEKLADRDFRVRELADRSLRTQGGLALPALRKALGHKELEVRRRALRLIPTIETAKLFSPKRVSFKVTDASLAKVLEELSKASGYKVTDGNNGMGFPIPFPVQPAPKGNENKGKTYSYEFLNEPFWDAVERICRDAGLSVQQSWGDETVRLAASNGHAPFAGRHGPFRYVGQNLQLYRNIDLHSSNSINRTETLTLNFLIFAEPRLPFMNMGEVRLEAAYDNLKNSMLPVRDPNAGLNEGMIQFGRGFGRRYYGGNYKQMMMSGSIALEKRSEKATTLKLVKGVVPMTVLVAQKPITIADKILSAKGAKKVVGDLTFEVKDVKKQQNNQVQVQFTVTNKQTGDYSWQNSLYNRVELHDDKGNKFQIWGTSWGGSGPSNVNMTLTFNSGNIQKPGEPAKFVFVHWEMKQYDVEFEFRDVPLP